MAIDWEKVRAAVDLARSEGLVEVMLYAAMPERRGGKYFGAVQHGLRPLLALAQDGDPVAVAEWNRAGFLGPGARPSRLKRVLVGQIRRIVDSEQLVPALGEHLSDSMFDDPDLLEEVNSILARDPSHDPRAGLPLQLGPDLPIEPTRKLTKKNVLKVVEAILIATDTPGFDDFPADHELGAKASRYYYRG